MKVFDPMFLVLSLVVASVSVSVLISATTDNEGNKNHHHLRRLSPFGGGIPLGRPLYVDDPRNCEADDFKFPDKLLDIWNNEKANNKLPPFITKEIFGMIGLMKVGWTPGFNHTETPIVSRLTHLIDTMSWNCVAMYSSTWLDGLTNEDPLIRSPISFDNIIFHDSTPRLLCMVHAYAAVVKEWHPEAYTPLSNIISAHGYEDVSYGFNSQVDNTFNMQTGEVDKRELIDIAAQHCYSPKIMGAIVARQLTEYGRHDGYNMYGDLGSDGLNCTRNCHRYTDSTGYDPNKNKSIGKRYRWKPMLEDDGRGYFTRQEHVTPHIGFKAKRAVLSVEQFENRTAKGIDYHFHMYNKESEKVVKRLKETATDDMKKAKIEFFDNKISVVFAILKSVASYGLTFEQIVNFCFGLTSSEYDSILVAWKQKVLYNRVRPTTWIQTMMAEDVFETYGGPYQGVKNIIGKEFESWARVMPHSEYISGSACICQSFEDYTDQWMELTVGSLNRDFNKFTPGKSIKVPIATDKTGREPPFLAESSKTERGVTPKSDLTLVAESMEVLRQQCGKSRLDGGMHFDKAVYDAYPLCQGIGNIVAKYSLALLGVGGWNDEVNDVVIMAPNPSPGEKLEQEQEHPYQLWDGYW